MVTLFAVVVYIRAYLAIMSACVRSWAISFTAQGYFCYSSPVRALWFWCHYICSHQTYDSGAVNAHSFLIHHTITITPVHIASG
jgi:hypothetical protein